MRLLRQPKLVVPLTFYQENEDFFCDLSNSMEGVLGDLQSLSVEEAPQISEEIRTSIVEAARLVEEAFNKYQDAMDLLEKR